MRINRNSIKNLISLAGIVLCVFVITGAGRTAHKRIDELEAYINDVELRRSQDRAEFDSLKEDLCGPRESVKPSKP